MITNLTSITVAPEVSDKSAASLEATGTPRTLRGAVIMPLAEQRGGGELMCWHLALQGRGQGIDWTFIFLEDGPMVGQVRELGLNALVFHAGRMREVHKLLGTAQRIAAFARREKVDFLLGWMGTAQLYGGMASLFSKVPALWYQLGTPVNPGMIDRIATALPAKAIFTCSQTGEKAQAGIKPSRPIRIVYPGVELDRYDPARLPTPTEARAKLGLPSEGPLIGIVGRLQRWKGMHVLVDAMPDVLREYPNAHAVIVGGAHAFEPEYESFLQKHIKEKGLQDRILMVGLQKNVPEWMQAMDVFVHASDNEPFGMVIIEAMALGKPVVATDCGGPTEIITPGVDGLLTPYGDAHRLAEALLRYLGEPEFRLGVSDAARRRAPEFSVERYAGDIIAHCRDFIV